MKLLGGPYHGAKCAQALGVVHNLKKDEPVWDLTHSA